MCFDNTSVAKVAPKSHRTMQSRYVVSPIGYAFINPWSQWRRQKLFGKTDLWVSKNEQIIGLEKFYTFNCADYANNPELLSSILFGHTKGAFTGAESEKQGLLAQANNSVLF